MMGRQTDKQSPEFQQFLQEVEMALIKASAEARRLAEQTGTKFIVRESFDPQNCSEQAQDHAAAQRDEEQHSAE
jgi:hypothetical protein